MRTGGQSSRDGKPSSSDFAEWLAAAHAFADVAGTAILPQYRRRLDVTNKAGGGGFDPVTRADRGAERAISRELARRFPDHGLLGEEHGERNPDARLKWVVDPIDGTKAFILGLPVWGTLIGLTLDGEPILGLMDQSYVRERFWSDARGAYSRDPSGRTRKLKTRSCAALADAMLMTTSPDLFAAGRRMSAFHRVRQQCRMTRYGGDCYAYAMVASGHVDLVVEDGLKPYDVMALIPIIERAGGRITTWTGESARAGGSIVASGDPRLHDAALKALAG